MMKPTEQAPTDRVSTEHAARYLGLSPRTLHNWRWMGIGPAYVKMGRAVRYDRRTLDAWMAGRTYDSTSAADNGLPVAA
jgi:hypothetical protein